MTASIFVRLHNSCPMSIRNALQTDREFVHSAHVPFLLLTCSKISCLAVTSFSNRSIFFINLFTWSGVGEVDASVNVSVHVLVHFSPHMMFLFLLQSLFQLPFLLTQLSVNPTMTEINQRTTIHMQCTPKSLLKHTALTTKREESRLVKVLLDFSMYMYCTHI